MDCVSARIDRELGERPDEHFFDVPDVPANVPPFGFQHQDGVTDKLARPVIRDVPATIRLDEGNASVREQLAAGPQRGPGRVTAFCDDVRVFEEIERVVSVMSLKLFDASALERVRVFIRDQFQIVNHTPAHYRHPLCGVSRSATMYERNFAAAAPSINR